MPAVLLGGCFSWRPLPTTFNTLQLGYQQLLTQDLARKGVAATASTGVRPHMLSRQREISMLL